MRLNAFGVRRMDFARLLICPGAQKAGTTWLHRVLKKHPDFWMPPQKELDYLFYHRPSREKYASKLGAKLDDSNLPAAAREWISLFIDDWDLARYPSLFRACGDRFSADISPNYSRMSAKEMISAAELVKGAKIALILRDPVERAWSHAKYASRAWYIEDYELRTAKCSEFVNTAICDLMSNYPRLVKQWSGQFGFESVLILFYDDLTSSPESFINKILSFLGATPYPRNVLQYLDERPNSSEGVPVPDDVRESLRKRYAPRMAELRRLLTAECKYCENGPKWMTSS